MKKVHLLTKVGLAFLSIGLLGLALPIVYFRYVVPSQQPLKPLTVAPINNQIATASAKEQIISGHPAQISIPSLDISLKVSDGEFNQQTGQWTLSLDHAHYAIISALPNSKMGNTFIYGHYRPEVFARLHRIQSDGQAEIKTDNGYSFIYRLQSVRETTPNDTSVFAYQGAPILTIQTCSGAWFQNRQFFTFSLVSYQKTT